MASGVAHAHLLAPPPPRLPGSGVALELPGHGPPRPGSRRGRPRADARVHPGPHPHGRRGGAVAPARRHPARAAGVPRRGALRGRLSAGVDGLPRGLPRLGHPGPGARADLRRVRAARRGLGGAPPEAAPPAPRPRSQERSGSADDRPRRSRLRRRPRRPRQSRDLTCLRLVASGGGRLQPPIRADGCGGGARGPGRLPHHVALPFPVRAVRSRRSQGKCSRASAGP